MTEDAAYRATALGEAYARIERLPVTVLLDNVRSLYNVGAFFRTADAVRAESIVLAGITPTPDDPRIAKTALGAERSVSWSKAADAAAAIDALRARGIEIAAIETSLHAVDLFDWQPRFPVCVVFGHEVDGIPPRSSSAVTSTSAFRRSARRGRSMSPRPAAWCSTNCCGSTGTGRTCPGG